MIGLYGLSSKNYALTSSCGAFSSTSVATTYTDITNLSQSLTVCGARPVLIMLVPDGSSNQSYVGAYNGTYSVNSRAVAFVVAKRDTTNIAQPLLLTGAQASTDVDVYQLAPPSSFIFWDWPSAGTYTYKLQAAVDATGMSAEIYYCKMLIMEVLY